MPLKAEERTAAREVLRAARELLMADRWCQGNRALTAAGDETSPSDPSAVSFCIVGALRCVERELGQSVLPAVHVLYEALVRRHDWNTPFPWSDEHVPAKVERLEEWNDGVAQDPHDVLSLYDRAIGLLEGC
jgi:hypothetical protein